MTTDLDIHTQPDFGGLRPDFVGVSPDGQVVVIEAKSVEQSDQALLRAATQVRRYLEVLGADAAVTVVPDDETSILRESGVLPLSELQSYLLGWMKRGRRTGQASPAEKLDPGSDVRGERAVVQDVEKTIFAAMPFQPEYDDVFWFGMRPAAQAVDATCVRIDHERYVGDVVEAIKSEIEKSVAVIADLSGSRPSVLYETGYAHARRLPTVQICSTDLADLPFDVSHDRTIIYRRGQSRELERELRTTLAAILP